MPWQVSVHSDPAIIETRYTGQLSATELGDAVRASLALAMAHGTLVFLSDCTQLEGGHSLFDLYYLADAVVASGLPGSARQAVLVPGMPGGRAQDAVLGNHGPQPRIRRPGVRRSRRRDRVAAP